MAARPAVAEALLTEDDRSAGSLVTIARGLLLALLFIFCVRFLMTLPTSGEGGNSFLHLVNLPFHEAGHIFFSVFGRFLQSLGGTLMQLLVPLVLGGYFFYWREDAFGASVCLWWLGQNFVDIAPYIADARAGKLLLLGGNRGWEAPYGFHDWLYILNECGLLAYDVTIALFSHALGILLMLTALIWGGALIWTDWKRPGSLMPSS